MDFTDEQLHAIANFSREAYRITHGLQTAVNARSVLDATEHPKIRQSDVDASIARITAEWLSAFETSFGVPFPRINHE